MSEPQQSGETKFNETVLMPFEDVYNLPDSNPEATQFSALSSIPNSHYAIDNHVNLSSCVRPCNRDPVISAMKHDVSSVSGALGADSFTDRLVYLRSAPQCGDLLRSALGDGHTVEKIFELV